jgi:septum formation protein
LSPSIKIILASTSPRRVTLLDQIGLNYSQIKPQYEEDSLNPNPRVRVMENSEKKALSVKDSGDLIISADTLVYINKEILGKPKNLEDAREMLRKISGKVHTVFTGVTVFDPRKDKIISSFEKTLVHIKILTEEDIENYILSGEPMGKAGAYAIQGLGAALVDRVLGCFHNVMGLPLSLVWDLLKEFDMNPFDLVTKKG